VSAERVPPLHEIRGMRRVGWKVLKACWAALAFILAATGVIG
jgi:hypothetical protein